MKLLAQKGFAPIIAILGVLMLSGVIIGGAYYLKTQQNKSKISNLAVQPTSTPTQQQNPTDETANWETYTNKEYNFRLNYPATWEVNESLPNQSSESGDKLLWDEIQKVAFSERNPKDGTWQGGIEFTVFKNQKNLSLEQWARQYFRPLMADPTVNLAKIVGDTILASQPAKKFSIIGVDAGRIAIFTIHNNYIYHVEFVAEVPESFDIKNNLKVYDQILSTFKFLDQEPMNKKKQQTTTCKDIFSLPSSPNMGINPLDFYCGGFVCEKAINKKDCELIDVVRIEDGMIVTGEDGDKDCSWISNLNQSVCVSNK